MARRIFGTQESKAKGQFEINPALQRTRASGNDKSLELGTKIPAFQVVQDDIVALPNRSVPRNIEAGLNKKRVPRVDQPSFQGVPKPR